MSPQAYEAVASVVIDLVIAKLKTFLIVLSKPICIEILGEKPG